ncbi:MAG: hypothetical protein H7249_05715 [Chitinophagaceae bacterium]|nr:hypothetical protein [Oligoflexus sp.]
MHRFLLTVWFVITLVACATPKLTLSSDHTAEVTSLNYSKGIPSKRTNLGKTPLTLDKKSVEGMILEIKAADSKAFDLYIPRTDGVENTINVELEKEAVISKTEAEKDGSSEKKPTEIDHRQAINRIMRVLFKSTQALYENNTTAAIELANQAMSMDPNIASPHILRGLAELQSGRTQDAQGSFAKAKALDPENTDVDAFIKGIP